MVAYRSTETQLGDEVVGVIEIGHLDVGRADRIGNMGVAARPRGQAVCCRDRGSALVLAA